MKTVYVALFLLTILTSYLHGVVNKYSLWLDDDGAIIPEPKTRDFIDIDNDGIPEEKKALMEQYKTDAKSLHESIKSAAKLNHLSRE